MNYKIKYQKGGFNYDSTSSSDSELDTLSSEKDYKTQQLKIPIIYFDFFMKTFNKTKKIINNNPILTKTDATQPELSTTVASTSVTPIVVDPKCIRTDADIQTAVNEWIADPITGTEKYCHISNWDTSRVTNMSYMFFRANSFNESLNSWDVSSVNDMNSMFEEAFSFNKPLDSWNVSSVTDMSYMFKNASSFNKPLNSWDVSSVNTMRSMFFKASLFNQDLNSWNVKPSVKKVKMFDGSAVSPIPSWY